MIIRICKTCRKEFKTYSYLVNIGKGKYCCRNCFELSKFKGDFRICEHCSKKFWVSPYQIKLNWGRFCSKKCHLKYAVLDNSSRWKGGKFMNLGYILIKMKHPFLNSSGYIFEHRLIAEKYLNRYLTLKERIHHINGIKSDNRPENLYLFSSPNKHDRYEHLKNKPILKSNLI